VTNMEERIVRLEEQTAANHKQNRGDIHRLFNGQQDLLDAITKGLESIGEKISRRCDEIEKDVVDLRLWRAKAVGYIAGVSALGGVLFEVGKGVVGRITGWH
jgi:hypothetical protein